MSTQEMVMTTQDVANRLVELCSKGDFEGAQRELYADECISIEPYESPDFAKETKGLDAILAKGEKWGSMLEASYGMKVSAPLVATNAFAVTMSMDVKMKGRDRMTMTELCVYLVKDGKIVSEAFFM
jgi:hypothetical protein